MRDSHRLGVRLSVCPSVTLRYCIKQTQARITKSSLWVAARTLVYRNKILYAWVRRFPSNWGVKEGYVTLKFADFTAIGWYSV